MAQILDYLNKMLIDFRDGMTKFTNSTYIDFIYSLFNYIELP